MSEDDLLGIALGLLGGTAVAYHLTHTKCSKCGIQNNKKNKRCKNCGAYL